MLRVVFDLLAVRQIVAEMEKGLREAQFEVEILEQLFLFLNRNPPFVLKLIHIKLLHHTHEQKSFNNAFFLEKTRKCWRNCQLSQKQTTLTQNHVITGHLLLN